MWGLWEWGKRGAVTDSFLRWWSGKGRAGHRTNPGQSGTVQKDALGFCDTWKNAMQREGKQSTVGSGSKAGPGTQ